MFYEKKVSDSLRIHIHDSFHGENVGGFFFSGPEWRIFQVVIPRSVSKNAVKEKKRRLNCPVMAC